MIVRQPRYSKEEFTRLGTEMYERDIRSRVEAAHVGKFVALDIETGAWEVDVDALTACNRLIAHLPDCQLWLVRVGYTYVHRMGGSGRTVQVA